jgi:hypothetical protein
LKLDDGEDLVLLKRESDEVLVLIREAMSGFPVRGGLSIVELKNWWLDKATHVALDAIGRLDNVISGRSRNLYD